MPHRVPRRDFLGGLLILALAAFAWWLARPLPAGGHGGVGPIATLDDGATRKRLFDLGSAVPDKAGRSPQALQKLVQSEVARWTPILKGASQ